jgi:uncharacterized protein YeaO (DUF488 family)
VTIYIKRAYDAVTDEDGYRVLVDRLWPRGVRKETLALDEWCKDVAPSTGLRQWFGHDPARFQEFAAKYREELENRDVPEQLLKRTEKNKALTLIYAAKDPKINHAVVLRDYLQHIQN